MLRERVPLGAGQRVSVDLALKVGSFNETITVAAERTLLQTATASLGLSVEAGQIDSLPLSGRAPSSLVKLAGGVNDLSSPTANTRPFDSGGTSNFAIGGGQVRTSDLLLDGGPNMARDRRISYNPPADIVQEVTVETFQSDAAFGNTQSGTVNIVTKGGTNEFHGSAGFYTQPSELAGDQLLHQARGRQGSGLQVQPGRLHGRRSGGHSARLRRQEQAVLDPVVRQHPQPLPRTDADDGADGRRCGAVIFPSCCALGDVYRIYDPMTGVAAGQRRQREPFPNNVIPPERLDPIALAYLNYYPLPNQPGEANKTGNYLIFKPPHRHVSQHHGTRRREPHVQEPPDGEVVRQRPRRAERQPLRQHRHRRDPAAAQFRRDGRLCTHAHQQRSVQHALRLDAVRGLRAAGEHRLRHDVDRLPAVGGGRVAAAGAAAGELRRHDDVAGTDRRQPRRRRLRRGVRFVPVVHLGQHAARRACAEGRRRPPLPARSWR